VSDKFLKVDAGISDTVQGIGEEQAELQAGLMKASNKLKSLALLVIAAAGENYEMNDQNPPRFEMRDGGMVLILPELPAQQDPRDIMKVGN